MNSQDELLHYYQQELSYLRKSGAGFARQYPKIAGNLALGPEECTDPHIERLLESFAFLTGRIQRQLASEFPEITSALLGTLYPQLVTPIPPMAIAQFQVDPTQGDFTVGHHIPKETPLFAHSSDELLCRFRTAYPVTLWPLDVVAVGIFPPDQFEFLDSATDVSMVIRIKLECQSGMLSELQCRRLRFFIHGEPVTASVLYDAIFGQPVQVAVIGDCKQAPRFLPSDSLQAVGFNPSEQVLPYPNQSHPGYRLLQEYSSFPEKFRFFDIDYLELSGAKKTFDVLLLLREPPSMKVSVNNRTFSLGCTPVINLFNKTSEPIRLDHRQSAYRLVPDVRREQTTEVHSILRVSASSNAMEETKTFEPLYAYSHHMETDDHQAFWYAKRQWVGHVDRPGTELVLSFVDLNFHPNLPPVQSVFAHTLCTNRFLAEQIPVGGELQIEGESPKAMISLLTRPTRHHNPPMGGQTPWRLISHLSLNHLSLCDGKEGLQALREILKLYNPTKQPSVNQQILGLTQMMVRPVTRRIGTEAWRGFCRGLEVTLTVNEECYVGSSPIMFASVLNHFMALYASMNTFTQLKLCSHNREGVWKQWPPLAGERILL